METINSRDKSEEELLMNTGLFKFDDLRNIIVNRKNFEYKIKRKEKSAFFSYIDHEIKLLEKIKSYENDTTDIERILSVRITKLHRYGLESFKHDLKLWLSHIKFCMQAGYMNLVNEAFSLMLAVHTDKRLWHLAAKWEITQYNNYDKALNYLYRGLQNNHTATCLYTHILKLELLSVSSRQPNETKRNLEDLKQNEIDAENKALKIFELAINKVGDDLDLFISLLKETSEYKYTEKLQARICKYLIDSFSENEMMWHVMAQREYNGFHLSEDGIYLFVPETQTEDRIKNCIEKYKSVIKFVDTPNMWEKYLNTLIDLYEGKESNDFVKENFLSACKMAHKKSLMSENHYMVWLECLNDSPELTEILEFATKSKPMYVQLWVARIRHHLSRKEETLIDPIFDEAIKALGNNSIQIWRRKVQYYQFRFNDLDKIDAVYRDGLNFSSTVSRYLQPQYLEWLALFKTKDVVLMVYKELSERQPFCIEVHKKMAELEAMGVSPSEEVFKSIKDVIRRHPSEEIRWREYVDQEIHYGPTWRREIYQKNLSSG